MIDINLLKAIKEMISFNSFKEDFISFIKPPPILFLCKG